MALILRGLIFDMDGTLADTLPVCFAAFRAALGSADVTMTDAELEAHFGPTEEGIVRKLVPPARGDDAVRVYHETYEREHRLCTEPYPGLREAIAQLRARGVRLAVATGKCALSAQMSIRVLGLERVFDRVESGSDEKFVKPDLLRRIIAHWGFPPETCAYIGDVPWDISAAHEVGAIGLSALWGEEADAGAHRAKCPDAVFETVGAYQEWIDTEVNPPAG